MIYFDSDYMAGAAPEVMDALLRSNMELTAGYGADPYTAEAQELIRKATGCPDAEVRLLVGGTQTNATLIDASLAHHEGVLSAESGHIAVHEAGAIEASGHKVLTLPHREGKVCAEDVERYITDFYNDATHEHMVAPGMLYISQPTEYGTIYSLAELEALSDICHRHDIFLYIDGARLGYALAATSNDATLSDIARLADIFYIGGTKCGALFGEAAVIPKPEGIKHLFSIIKQHGALLAKGRLLGVQFATLFRDGLYERLGSNAVEQAMRLREAFEGAGYRSVVASPTNQQFFRLPNDVIDRLREHISFDYWGPRGETESTVRLVTSWYTTKEDIDKVCELLHDFK